MEQFVEGFMRELLNYAVAGGVLTVIILATVGFCTVVKAVCAR